jgi:hypothetical protein
MTNKTTSGIYYINDFDIADKCSQMEQQIQNILAKVPFLQSNSSLDLLGFLDPKLFPGETNILYYHLSPFSSFTFKQLLNMFVLNGKSVR